MGSARERDLTSNAITFPPGISHHHVMTRRSPGTWVTSIEEPGPGDGCAQCGNQVGSCLLPPRLSSGTHTVSLAVGVWCSGVAGHRTVQRSAPAGQNSHADVDPSGQTMSILPGQSWTALARPGERADVLAEDKPTPAPRRGRTGAISRCANRRARSGDPLDVVVLDGGRR